jgi:hypothetical protein
MKNLPDLKNHLSDDIVNLFTEVQQSRSRVQLEKFVVGAHQTKQMQYFQIILELQKLYYTIKEVTLQMQKTQIEIDRLKSSADEIDAIEAQIKELGLEQTRVVGVGAFREVDILVGLLKEYPNYTREQIELDQENYWQLRLSQQTQMNAIGGDASTAANLTALAQLGVLSLDDNTENKVKEITE